MMDIKKGNSGLISAPSFWAAKNGLDPDEVYSFITALIDQNADLVSKLEKLDSLIKLSEDASAEARRKAEHITSEIEKEARNRASAIISEAENKAKAEADRIKAEAERKTEEARQERINTAIQEGQVITQKAIETAEAIEARAEAESRKIIAEAKKEAESSRKEVRKFAEQETQNILKEQIEEAPREALPAKRRAEKRDGNSDMLGKLKGMMRYNWNMEIKGQQYDIELQLDTILGRFALGSGQWLVNGEVLSNWGLNLLRVIPKGKLDFEISGIKAVIKSRGTTTDCPVLVLGDQEIPPVVSKI